jgi:glycerol uptake facilitator-like aquaporin
MLRGTWREAAAELVGTFVLIVFGTASAVTLAAFRGFPWRKAPRRTRHPAAASA